MKNFTFHNIIKCSLLKLLFTLARLYEGTHLQKLQLDFFGIYITLTSYLTIYIFHFSREVPHLRKSW